MSRLDFVDGCSSPHIRVQKDWTYTGKAFFQKLERTSIPLLILCSKFTSLAVNKKDFKSLVLGDLLV